MVLIECEAKKWGSSIGIVLPRDLIRKINVKPKEKITIDVKKIHRVDEFFGMLPNWKTDTQQLKDKAREGW